MIRRIIVLVLIVLFMASNATFAANWVFLQRQEGTREGPCTEYIDTDSVVRYEDKVVYWTIWVLDEKLGYDGARKIMFKKEVPLVYPLRHRNLEIYRYDGEDVEIRRYLMPTNTYYAGSPDETNQALQYARPAKVGEVTKPDPAGTPTPRWYGFIELPDCDLYWNINSITAWPRDNPTTVGIIVKLVWNKEGLEKRKAYLMSKPYQAYEGVKYTLVSYQFLTFENRVRIKEVTDYREDNTRISLLGGTDWLDIEKGSKEEWARKIALNWLNDREGTGGK